MDTNACDRNANLLIGYKNITCTCQSFSLEAYFQLRPDFNQKRSKVVLVVGVTDLYHLIYQLQFRVLSPTLLITSFDGYIHFFFPFYIYPNLQLDDSRVLLLGKRTFLYSHSELVFLTK